MLDVFAVVTVAQTLTYACKVVFLVQLPYLPMNPWPELKQDHQDECRGQGSVFFVMKAETYFEKLLLKKWSFKKMLESRPEDALGSLVKTSLCIPFPRNVLRAAKYIHY